jgi:hypothetical protein
MNKSLSQLIRSTKEYSDVCDTCKDEILIYPTISGRTDYSQDEVEQITLKRIIDKLQAKEQECEHWKNQCLCLDGEDVTVQISQEQFEEYQNYKQALDEIYNVVFIDDMNCEVSKEVQDLSNTVINIINKAKER